jgi:hypothetical protein
MFMSYFNLLGYDISADMNNYHVTSCLDLLLTLPFLEFYAKHPTV